MTDTEIIRAVAELDGWEEYYPIDPNPEDESGYINGNNFCRNLPAYLTSRDAIVPVIESRADTHMLEEISNDLNTQGCFYHFQATPRQLCEALLRATGRWKE